MYIVLDIFMFFLVSLSWVAITLVVGWPLRRLNKRFDNREFDLSLLVAVFLLEPLTQPSLSLDRYFETFVYLPFAALIIFWVHKE